MDAVMAERVNALARSLKELHLVASNEEAYARAEEILLGSANKTNAVGQELPREKTLNELMGETNQTADKQENAPVAEQQEIEEIFIAPSQAPPENQKPQSEQSDDQKNQTN